MLIEIDRSIGQSDRVGSAIDFRDSFSSRAGSFGSRGFAGGDGFDNCNGDRLDDRQRCDGHGRPMAHDCGRVAVRAALKQPARWPLV
jgi:hypothetical protein